MLQRRSLPGAERGSPRPAPPALLWRRTGWLTPPHRIAAGAAHL